MDFDRDEISLCPSFNIGSEDGSADIASRVANEINYGESVDCDFDFSFVSKDGDVLGNEFLHNLRIETMFPVFDRDLLPRKDFTIASKESESRIQIPSIEIFVEEKNNLDESEMVPTGAYCVWQPKNNKSAGTESPRSPKQIKKKKSTVSASQQNNSNWKTDLVFLASTRTGKEPTARSCVQTNGKGTAISRTRTSVPASVHEVFYVRYREMKEEEKRKSFLPYRQDLVGIFSHAHSARRLPLL